MTTVFLTRATLRRSARLGLAGAALLAAATGASADEDALGGFLASIFGGQPRAAAQQSQPAPAPQYAPAYGRRFVDGSVRHHLREHPLVVRLHRARPTLVVAQAPTKPGKVSIYEDRTLRRGDAVMTADGVRVFAGSSSWPYTDGDFVGLKDAKTLDRDTSKVLAQLDKLPRG